MSRGSTLSGLLSLLVGIGSLVVAVWWVTRPPPLPPPPPPRPPFVLPVTVVSIATGDVREQVELVGDVAAPERAKLAFERAGRLKEVPARLGDVVKTGAVLAQLDDGVMEKEVEAAAAELKQAQEQSAMAEREAERIRKVGDAVASAAELDRAESLARSERQRVAKLAADVDVANARLAQGILRAPFDALVAERPVSVGTYVASGDLCFDLLALEHREVLLDVPPHVAAATRPGANVTLHSDALPGFALESKLLSMLPSPQARARTFTGVVRLEPRDDPERRLQPGMFVRAVIELRAAQGALVVPVDALLEGEEGTRLALASPGNESTASFVRVRVLARDDAKAAVEAVEGELHAGDLVVLTGKENAFAGAKLLPLPANGTSGRASPAAGAASDEKSPAKSAGSGSGT